MMAHFYRRRLTTVYPKVAIFRNVQSIVNCPSHKISATQMQALALAVKG